MLLLFFLLILPAESAELYYFIPRNDLSHEGNWISEERACVDDKIIFDQHENIAVYFDSDILISQMTLPDDGVFYYNRHVAVGKPGPRQCNKRKSPEDVYFNLETPFGSWFDPENWNRDNPVVLHMQMIPNSLDDVYFESESLQMYLEVPPSVGLLTYGERVWNDDTFDSLLYTVEGQFRISLGHDIGTKGVLEDIEFNVPSKQKAMHIGKPELNYWDKKLGLRNSNSDPKIMSKICQYVTCNKTSNICLDPVKPFGHCCDVCGAVLNLTTAGGDRGLIHSTLNERFVSLGCEEALDWSLERMDSDGVPYEFQIALLSKYDEYMKKHGIQSYKFDECVNTMIEAVKYDIARTSNFLIDYHVEFSKQKPTLGGYMLFFAKISGLLVLIGIGLAFTNKEHRWVDRIRARNIEKRYAIVAQWHRGEREDSVQLESTLLATRERELESEEESPQQLVSILNLKHEDLRNLSFSPPEELLYTEGVEMSSLSHSEGPPSSFYPEADDVEMTLINY